MPSQPYMDTLAPKYKTWLPDIGHWTHGPCPGHVGQPESALVRLDIVATRANKKGIGRRIFSHRYRGGDLRIGRRSLRPPRSIS